MKQTHVIILVIALLLGLCQPGALFPVTTSGRTPRDLKSCNGDIYVTGTVSVAEHDEDVFLTKYSSDGTLVWDIQEGGARLDISSSLVCVSGGVIIAGYFSNEASFSGQTKSCANTQENGPDRGSKYRQCLFVARYTSHGDLEWFQQSYGQFDLLQQISLALGDGDNVIVGGSFSGSMGIGVVPSLVSVQFNLFLVSYNSAGNPLWAQRIQSVSGEVNHRVLSKGDGRFFVVGQIYSDTTFPGKLISPVAAWGQFYEVYFAEFDQNSTLIEVFTGHDFLTPTVAGPVVYSLNTVTIGDDGYYYLAVYEKTSYDATDLKLFKLDDILKTKWVVSLPCCQKLAITVDEHSQIYFTGSVSNYGMTFIDGMYFRHGVTVYYSMDSQNVITWKKAVTIVTNGENFGEALYSDQDFVYIAGQYTANMLIENFRCPATKEFGAVLMRVNKTTGELDPENPRNLQDPVLTLHSNHDGDIISTKKALQVSITVTPAQSTKMYFAMWLLEIVQVDGTIASVWLDDVLEPGSTDSELYLRFRSGAFIHSTTYILQVKLSNAVTSDVYMKEYIITTSAPVPTPSLSISPDSGDSAQLFKISQSSSSGRFEYIFLFFDEYLGRYVRLRRLKNVQMFDGLLPIGYNAAGNTEIVARVQNEYGEYQEDRMTVTITPSSSLASDTLQQIEQLVAPYVNGLVIIARAISVLPLDDAQALVTPLFNKLSMSGLQQDNFQTWVDVLEVITSRGLRFSFSETNFILRLLNVVASEEVAMSVARIISNVRQDTRADIILSSLYELRVRLVDSKLPNDAPTVLKTDSYEMIVQKKTKVLLENLVVKGESNSSIFVPDLSSVEEDEIGLAVILYPLASPLFTRPTNSTELSSVTDVTFFSGTTKLKLLNLQQPLELMLEHEFDIQGGDSSKGVTCVYLNETSMAWQSDGCELTNSSSPGIIVCACTHTTTFSAHRVYSPESIALAKQNVIPAIAISSVYTVVSLAAFSTLLLSFKVQPVASRFVAPYIAISSVIIEMILNGLLSNGMIHRSSSDNTSKWVNAINHTTSLIVNPLSLLALFALFWQNIRFIMLKRLYSMIAKHKTKQQTQLLKVLRVVTSKLVFAVLVGIIGLSLLTTFAILVALIESQKETDNNSMNAKWTAARATIFAVLFMAFAFGSVFVVIVDFTLSLFNRNQEKATLQLMSSEHTQQETRGGILYSHFIRSDPLMFRFESLFLFFMVLVMCIYYPIAVTHSWQGTSSSLGKWEIALGFLFTLLKILAFGGFVGIVGVCRLVVIRSTRDVKTRSEKEDFVNQVLNNELGFKMFLAYCEAEFSAENVLLWKDLKQVRDANTSFTTEERRTELSRIVDTYFVRNAEREVNVEAKTRAAIVELANTSEPSFEDSEKIFAKVYSAVMTNLSDTLARFTKTREYANYLKTKSIHSELQDTLSIDSLSSTTQYYLMSTMDQENNSISL